MTVSCAWARALLFDAVPVPVTSRSLRPGRVRPVSVDSHLAGRRPAVDGRQFRRTTVTERWCPIRGDLSIKG